MHLDHVMKFIMKLMIFMTSIMNIMRSMNLMRWPVFSCGEIRTKIANLSSGK